MSFQISDYRTSKYLNFIAIYFTIVKRNSILHIKGVKNNYLIIGQNYAQFWQKKMAEDILFEVTTPVGFGVRVTRNYWDLIVAIKHPVMLRQEIDVQDTLRTTDEIRRSRSDSSVFLFYRLNQSGRWICAVTKRLNGEGFLITTYPTDTIKKGERIWSK